MCVPKPAPLLMNWVNLGKLLNLSVLDSSTCKVGLVTIFSHGAVAKLSAFIYGKYLNRDQHVINPMEVLAAVCNTVLSASLKYFFFYNFNKTSHCSQLTKSFFWNRCLILSSVFSFPSFDLMNCKDRFLYIEPLLNAMK